MNLISNIYLSMPMQNYIPIEMFQICAAFVYRLGEITLHDIKNLLNQRDLCHYHFRSQDPACGTIKEEVHISIYLHMIFFSAFLQTMLKTCK